MSDEWTAEDQAMADRRLKEFLTNLHFAAQDYTYLLEAAEKLIKENQDRMGEPTPSNIRTVAMDLLRMMEARP